jgi:hypothetical protein
MMLATKYLLTLQILRPYYIERRERIFYAVLLDTTIKFDRFVYKSWDILHALEGIQYAA